MSKLRVYELAKELQIRSSELVERLKSAGFPVNNYMSSLDMTSVEKIRQHFGNFKHIRGRMFIIDGLNICRGYPQTKGQVSLEVLLSILNFIRNCGGSFKCIFDANTYFQLRDKGSPEAENFYKKLIGALPNYFCVAPGGKPADDFILMDADKNRYPIITNDKFAYYSKKYPWIMEEQERLIKGGLMGEDIMIPDLGINIPVRNDLEKMVEELIADLSPQAKP